MLDLAKLTQQMQGMSQHLINEAIAAQKRLDIADNLWQKAQTSQAELIELQANWADQMLFKVAIPVEPLNIFPTIPAPPKTHTVIATDGSQISPSHHEIAYCYLINVGRVMLHYGQSKHPLLDSQPEIFYQPEDLYRSHQWGIKTEEWMSYKRGVAEARELAILGESWVEFNQTNIQANTGQSIPMLALADGGLIYWFLDTLPAVARDEILEPILQSWDLLRRLEIPIAGYLSASRSSESLSFLRLTACQYQEPNCQNYCPHVVFANSDNLATKAPCQKFEPLRDAIFWSSILTPGQRSPLWKSSQRILEYYGEHTVYFCYLHVGTEVARIDFPAWVALDENKLNAALGMILGQVQKGYGYPVVLAEAHNQAVIRGGDRTHFFNFLEQEMIKAGLQNIGTSYKETRKRGSIA
jgi:hypothetical protein